MDIDMPGFDKENIKISPEDGPYESKLKNIENYLIGIIGIYVKKKNEKNNTIAVLMKTENNGFWNAIRAGAEDAAGDHGYRLLVRGPESEDSSQLPLQRELMSIMLSENPAAMAVATIADGFTDLLDEAYDRNVPLVQYDSGLFVNDLETVKHSDRNPLAGFVQGSSYDNAALLAEAVFDNLKDKIAMSESYVIGEHQRQQQLFHRPDNSRI